MNVYCQWPLLGTIIVPGEVGCQRRCQGDSYKACYRECHEGVREKRLLVIDYISGSLQLGSNLIVLLLIVYVLLLRLRPYCLNKRLL